MKNLINVIWTVLKPMIAALVIELVHKYLEEHAAEFQKNNSLTPVDKK